MVGAHHTSSFAIIMKTLIVAFTAILAIGSAQDGPECFCGMFITTSHDEYEVHRLPPFDLDNCQAVQRCKDRCAQEYKTFTNGGDLNHMLENGYTVGQEACLNMFLNHHVDHVYFETVYGYARHCNGPWDYDGQFSINRLCCSHGAHIDCDAVTGVPQ